MFSNIVGRNKALLEGSPCGGGRAELCQWALTHNRVVKGELKKFVQWNKEIR